MQLKRSSTAAPNIIGRRPTRAVKRFEMKRNRNPITCTPRQASHHWPIRCLQIVWRPPLPVNSRRQQAFLPAYHRIYLRPVSVKYLCSTLSSHPIVSNAFCGTISERKTLLNVASGWEKVHALQFFNLKAFRMDGFGAKGSAIGSSIEPQMIREIIGNNF